MAKEKKTPPHDAEEYTYSGDDFGEEHHNEPLHEEVVEPAVEPPKSQKLVGLLKKRILIVIGLIILIAVVYQFIKPDVEQAVESEAVSKTETAVSQQQQTRVREAPSVSTRIATETGQLKRQIQNLQQQGQRTQAQVQQFQFEMNKLKQSLTGVNKSVGSLNESVKKLRTDLKKQTKAAAPVFKIRKAPAKVRRPLPVYTVRALVPGRAWIASSTGTVLTVKVGDRLMGYGYVRGINPQGGVVTTSSGREIEYGAGDS